MWKLWLKTNVVFLILLLAVLSGVFAIHGRWPEWTVLGAFGAAGALLFAFMSYAQLARHHRERVRKHRAYWSAMQEVVDELAKQSLTDKSVFFAAFHQDEDGEIILTTSLGNPNCRALEQMADLGIVRPVPIRRTDSDAVDKATLCYSLDFKGLGTLCSLVEAAAKRRAFFDRTLQQEPGRAAQ